MRIYVLPWLQGYQASAPAVPGTWAEGKTKDEAVGNCRLEISEELASYERLGLSLPASTEIVELRDWVEGGPPFFMEDFLPPSREYVRIVLRRIEDLRLELDRFLDKCSPQEWEWSPEGEWNIRTLLDHIANSQWITIQRLDEWPLNPNRSQEMALDELLLHLGSLSEREWTRRTEHFGLNRENGRVSWTPSKVLRVVRLQQDLWLAYLKGQTKEPDFPLGHEDQPSDEQPPDGEQLQNLADTGEELLQASKNHARAAGWMAVLYRYYRRRMIEWPVDTRQRWEAIWQHSRERLLSLSDRELTMVRVRPLPADYGAGEYASVRQVLDLSLSHLKEHYRQMRDILERFKGERD